MRQKLVKKDEFGVNPMSDSESVYTKEHLDLIRWIEGKPINCNYSAKKVENYSKTAVIKDGLLTDVPLSSMYFTFTSKKDIDRKRWTFIDLDFKALVKSLTDIEIEEFKDDIISLVQMDSVLNSRVIMLNRSGKEVKNGLHIHIFSNGEIDRTEVHSKFIAYITMSLDEKWNKYFDTDGFVDKSSLGENRYINARFGIGFEHYNEEARWQDIEISFINKLIVPDAYESGFHNKLRYWVSSTNLEQQQVLSMYASDFNKQPFTGPKTFGEELKRLLKYLGRYQKSNIKKNLINNTIFYLNDKGKEIINKDKVKEKLFKEYKFIKEPDTDSIYMRRKDSIEWGKYYKDKTLNRWDFIPEIINAWNIESHEKNLNLAKVISEILAISDLNGIIPKRDLDDYNSIVFILKLRGGEIKQIRIKKDSVEFINQEYIKGSEVYLPLDMIDINANWEDFSLYKIGFYDNIVSNKEIYLKIIGYINHMDGSTSNGLRFVVHSDSSSDKQGGGGKTLSTLSATRLRNVQKLKYSKSNFIYQNCNITTNIINIDEFPKDGSIDDFRELYNNSPFMTEKKFRNPIPIDPVKLVINTNYFLSESDPDKERRVEIQFQNYYNREHNPVSKSTGGVMAFTDSRLQKNEKFTNLLGETIDPNQWWNNYVCFIIHCCQLYLNDMDTRFKDMVETNQVLDNKLTQYYDNPKYANIMRDIQQNIDIIIKTGLDSYSIRNTDICDIYGLKIAPRTMSIIPHMLKTYLERHTDYEYINKSTDRTGVVHIIQKNKKENENN